MNIFERLKYIADRIAIAEITGTSEAEIAMLIGALHEMRRVIKCLHSQLEAAEPVFINNRGDIPSGYIPVRNTSGMDFKRLSFEIDVVKGKEILKTITVETVGWKNGHIARFYFNEDLSEGKELIVGAEEVSYEIAYTRMH